MRSKTTFRNAIRNLLFGFLGDYKYEYLKFFLVHKYFPNIRKPRSYSEKLSWRKFFQKDLRFIQLSDKYKVRAYVKERIGGKFLSEIYWVSNDYQLPSIIDLPRKFVVKANFGSGPEFIRFVDANNFTKNDFKKLFDELLNKEFGKYTNEWWYSKIPKKVILEEFLTDDGDNPPWDYKLFVFHGKVQFIQVDYDRFINHTRTFYDKYWKVQPFELLYPRGPLSQRPSELDKMIEIAEELGKDFDFVRIDLYFLLSKKRIVFSEMTFCPEAGWGKFKPRKFDWIIGDLWQLSSKCCEVE